MHTELTELTEKEASREIISVVSVVSVWGDKKAHSTEDKSHTELTELTEKGGFKGDNVCGFRAFCVG